MDEPGRHGVTRTVASAALGAASLALRHTIRATRSVTTRLELRMLGRHPATVDALTQLGNRSALAERAPDLVPGAPPRALLLLDLDGFKRVNDTLGHLAGDHVLQEVARRISATLGPDDLAVRLGGDEFAVLSGPLAERASDAAAAALAESILDALADPLTVEGMTVPVGTSVGVAVHGTDGIGLEELLRAADQAMYAAKAAPAGASGASGRWRRVVHPGDGTGAASVTDLVEDLREGLTSGQLLLHHQPQVSWDGRVTGYEALLRWQHPRLGTLTPRQFLPAAERAGLLSAITREALAQALAAQPLLADRDAEVTVSVNVPARDLLRDDFVPELAALLGDDLPPSRITLEISEPTPFPVPTVARLFAELSELGVGISIHEFGAGQSSLTALAQYPGLREIKIDPTLVRQVAEDEGTARLVRAIINAAHGFEVEVVAEGVEDAATVRRLRELGCDRLQGYWISPPLPVADVAGWRERWQVERDTVLTL